MEFEVKSEMVTSIEDKELKAIFECNTKQGKFWFRLQINGCSNVDELYLHIMGVGLLDFQARQVCAAFGEYVDEKGETIAEIFGLKEGEVMSFMAMASSEDELDELVGFFVEGVKQMKEAVTDCLLRQIPEWVTEGKSVSI